MINLYLVGRIFEDDRWEVVGVFSSQEKAEAECREYNYMVGPLVLDHANHEDHIVWPGAYFPSQKASVALEIQDGQLGTTGGL